MGASHSAGIVREETIGKALPADRMIPGQDHLTMTGIDLVEDGHLCQNKGESVSAAGVTGNVMCVAVETLQRGTHVTNPAVPEKLRNDKYQDQAGNVNQVVVKRIGSGTITATGVCDQIQTSVRDNLDHVEMNGDPNLEICSDGIADHQYFNHKEEEIEGRMDDYDLDHNERKFLPYNKF